MADFVNTIDTLGDDVVVDSIINRTITEFFDNAITSVGESAFRGCAALTKAGSETVERIGSTAFQDSGIVEVHFPNATYIANYAFCRSKVKFADFPNVTTVGTNVFENAKTVTEINFPVLSAVTTRMFGNCSLTKADFPAVTSIAAYGLYGNKNLVALILRNTDKVCALANANAISEGVPIASGTGYIYVPAALVDSYKAATNWSTYASQFRALEDYTVDGTITGELDESKI